MENKNFFVLLFIFILSFIWINDLYSFPDIIEEEVYGADEEILDGESKGYYHDKLAGDLRGWRPWLLKRGVEVNSVFSTDIFGNVSGGEREGFAHADSWGVDLSADLEKLYGIKKTVFYTSVVLRGGENLSSRDIGNEFPVTQLFGGETLRFNECYLQSSLLDDHLVVKVGRLNTGNDFLQSPLYYNFVSNAICGNPIAVFFNTTYFAYPFAAWGAYAHVKTDRILGKVAIYDTNADIFDNSSHGCNFSFRSKGGVLITTEWGYSHNQGDKDVGLPGNYRFGCYYDTGEKEKFLGGYSRGNFGFYFLLDQMLYRPGGANTTEGLTAFSALLFAPVDSNLFPFFASNGLVYKGLFPGRKEDVSCLGFAYGSYSSDLRKSERQAASHGIKGKYGDLPQTFEAVVELNHRFQISDWLSMIIDLQYIINPKGYGTIPDALAVGTEIGVVF